MALSYSRKARLVEGNTKSIVVDITADSTYATGGYALARADVEALLGDQVSPVVTQGVSQLILWDSEANAGGVTTALDRVNNKILFFEAGAQATTTVSSTTVRVTAVQASSYK